MRKPRKLTWTINTWGCIGQYMENRRTPLILAVHARGRATLVVTRLLDAHVDGRLAATLAGLSEGEAAGLDPWRLKQQELRGSEADEVLHDVESQRQRQQAHHRERHAGRHDECAYRRSGACRVGCHVVRSVHPTGYRPDRA